MKVCYKCGIEKDITQFAQHRSRKDGLSAQCRSCHKMYKDAHYIRTKPRYLELTKIRNRKRKQERFSWMFGYFKDHPCVDCGETDPVVLDFDHVTGTKTYNISDIIGCGSWDKILKEVEKCQVRCSNCHRRKTAKDRNWYQEYL